MGGQVEQMQGTAQPLAPSGLRVLSSANLCFAQLILSGGRQLDFISPFVVMDNLEFEFHGKTFPP